MKRLIILLFFCSTAFGQYNGIKPILGRQANKAHHLGDFVACWLMNEGAGSTVADLSGNVNNGTILTDTVWDTGQFGSALLSDGSAGGVNCGNNPSLDITGDMTIVFLFNPDHTASTQRIFHKNTSYSLFLELGGDLRLYNYGDGSSATSSESVIVNSWQHIVVVKRGAAATFYRNSIDITSDSTITATFPVSVVNLYLGIDEDLSSYPYDGHLEYIYLYNRALSASEISQLYSNPFCMFKDPLPVTMMYDWAVAPSGQVIMIQMSVIPIILCLLWMNRKNA